MLKGRWRGNGFYMDIVSGWWQLKHFLFSPLFGEDSHFDSYFSDGLKPPTSFICILFVRVIYVYYIYTYYFFRYVRKASNVNVYIMYDVYISDFEIERC